MSSTVLLFSSMSYGDVVNITGTVTATPCTVDTTKSDLSVDIGSFDASSLSAAGATGGQKLFNLVLKDCPSTTSIVKATFTGTVYKDDNTAYANTGTATNLGLQVKLYTDPWASITTSPGGSTQVNVNATDHTATFAMATRPYTKTGGVTPGTINTPVTVTFSYQ